jgi:hypothetical protein
MLKKFTSAFAAFVVATALLLLGGTPARAAYADCPSGMFCVWIDGNYSGARWQVSKATIIDSYPANGLALPSWIDDEGSSVYNRTGYSVYVFDGSNCGPVGWNRLITANQRLTAPGSAINDRISSIQWFSAYPLLCNV